MALKLCKRMLCGCWFQYQMRLVNNSDSTTTSSSMSWWVDKRGYAEGIIWLKTTSSPLSVGRVFARQNTSMSLSIVHSCTSVHFEPANCELRSRLCSKDFWRLGGMSAEDQDGGGATASNGQGDNQKNPSVRVKRDGGVVPLVFAIATVVSSMKRRAISMDKMITPYDFLLLVAQWWYSRQLRDGGLWSQTLLVRFPRSCTTFCDCFSQSFKAVRSM